RSFRSSPAKDACHDDPAPTLPAADRKEFGLKAKLPPGCLAALDDPSRTLLGAHQKELLKSALLASDATWKLILNDVPITEMYGDPYDRWEGYAAERAELLRFLEESGVRNVVFLTTDLHGNLISDVRARPGDTVAAAKEIVAGPIAQRTLYQEL